MSGGLSPEAPSLVCGSAALVFGLPAWRHALSGRGQRSHRKPLSHHETRHRSAGVPGTGGRRGVVVDSPGDTESRRYPAHRNRTPRDFT